MKARHKVLSILFVTYVFSLMNRMAMSAAIPYIASDYHLSPSASGLLISVFFAAYTITQVPGGILADRFGARWVATIAMLWWSVFTGLTGAAANIAQMVGARFLFGLGEGVFPACSLKTIAVWFPQKERATANAIMLASNPLGTAIAPLAAVGVMAIWGWRAVFFCLFFPGILAALLFWLYIPDKPSESRLVSPEELIEIDRGRVINTNPVAPNTSVPSIFRTPLILQYCLVQFTFSIAYWGLTAWLPTYLVKARGFSMTQMGMAASLPFLAGTVGAVLGGNISDKYFKNNRRAPIVATQLIAAALLYLMLTANSAILLVIWEMLAGFFLVFFYSVFWALPMNTISAKQMGTAGGVINMSSQLAAFISPIVVGYLLDRAAGNYRLAFAFLIGALLISSILVFTLPSTLQPHQE